MVGVVRPPDEYGLAHDVVLGHEAPVARVGRVVAVVAHHPVVVHLEGVARGGLAVDVYASAAHLQVVALVHLDGPLVYGYVVHGEPYGGSALGNPYGAVVVARPACVAVEGIYVAGGGVGGYLRRLHEALLRLEHLQRVGREGHAAALVEHGYVLVGYAELTRQVVGYAAHELQVVHVLHVVGLLVGLAVEVHYAVLYLKRLAGKAHAALHVVLAAVYGARVYLAESLSVGVGGDVAAAYGVRLVEVVALLLARHGVEVGRGAELSVEELLAEGVCHAVVVLRLPARLGADGVAGRVVEHHDVVDLDGPEALGTLVLELRPLYVRLQPYHRERVLGEGHGEGGHGLARAVAHLRHEEVVAREQRLLKRRRRYDVVLEEEYVDEVHGDEREHQRVYPRHHAAHERLAVAPPLPAYLLGDVHVVYEGHDDEAEQALHPYQERSVEHEHYYELGPLLAGVESLFLFVYHCMWFVGLSYVAAWRGVRT